MEEVEAMDFYERVTSGDNKSKTITLEHQTGAALEVELTVVDRKTLLDQLSRLPDEMMESIEDAEDVEEAEEEVRDSGMMSNLNGDTVGAFEEICVESIEHEELTSHHVRQIVEELDFEVLFPIGAEAIELSFDNSGKVSDFHGLDTDKN